MFCHHYLTILHLCDEKSYRRKRSRDFFFHRMIFVSFCTTIAATVAAVVILLVRFHHLIFRIALFLHLDNSPVFLFGSLLFHSVSCSPSWNSVFAHQRYFILLCVNLVMWKGNQLRMNLSFSESMRLFLMYSLSPYFFCMYLFILSFTAFFPVFSVCIDMNCVFASNVCFASWFNSFTCFYPGKAMHCTFSSALFSYRTY